MERDDLPRWIAFAVLAVALVFGFQFFVAGPEAARQRAALAKNPPAASAQAAQSQAQAAQAATGAVMSQAQALASSPRVAIETPMVTGSVALRGARLDDLSLTKYRVTVDPRSPEVQVLRPQGAGSAFYAIFPWVGAGGSTVPGLPDANTVWTAAPGAKLTPATPITLTYDNGQGLKFTRVIAIDANYMFTVADTVANAGPQAVSLQPMGVVAQIGPPADFDFSNAAHPHATSSLVHEGGVGVVDGQLKLPSYTCSFGQLFCNAWKKDQPIEQTAVGGWLGITQKYWLAALVPDQKSTIHAAYQALATTAPTPTRPPTPARRRPSPPAPRRARRPACSPDRRSCRCCATTGRPIRSRASTRRWTGGSTGSSPAPSSPASSSSTATSPTSAFRSWRSPSSSASPSSRSPTRATSR